MLPKIESRDFNYGNDLYFEGINFIHWDGLERERGSACNTTENGCCVNRFTTFLAVWLVSDIIFLGGGGGVNHNKHK